jgi:hypothetical protein
VRYDFGKATAFEAIDDFISAECAFAGCAPDIDSFGVQDKEPGVDAIEARTEFVEAQLIIRRNEYRRLGRGIANGK